MNELVQRLKLQAGINDNPDQEGLDLFAELIVKECADICMEMAAKCAGLPGDGALAKDCADWIKKDFGVEE
jgi:hypothetical protein